MVDRFLGRLSPGRHELVLFDINRAALKSPLLVDDPGPQTARLMDDPGLPFAVTVVGNESPESRRVVARRKPPFSTDFTSEVELDEAAVRIVNLAAPYAPFPPDIRKDADVLHITRTWEFSTDRMQSR